MPVWLLLLPLLLCLAILSPTQSAPIVTLRTDVIIIAGCLRIALGALCFLVFVRPVRAKRRVNPRAAMLALRSLLVHLVFHPLLCYYLCMVATSLAAPAATGRPTKFTPELVATLLPLIEAGNPLETACNISGISYRQFRDWMIAGEQGDDRYSHFSQLVQNARAKAEQSIAAQWRNHFPSDWKAARDYLARQWPDHWADQSKRTLTVEGTVQVNHLAVIASTSLPDLYRLLAGAGGLIEAHNELPMPTAEPESAG